MKRILFVCSGGMSSAIVEKALNKEAKKQGIDLTTSAVGTGEAENCIETNEWDLILVAPQVKHRFDTFSKYANKKGTPIELIPPRDYSPLGGPNLLKLVIK